MNENLLRFPQVAKELGVSPATARRIAASDPTFPRIRDLGPRSRFVSMDDLRAYISSRTFAPAKVIS
jgi:predicted DNA-binding transcriptional regulator AlpA